MIRGFSPLRRRPRTIGSGGSIQASRIIGTVIAVPIALIVVATFPPAQQFFLPPPDTIAELIDVSRSRPAPSEPVRLEVEYDRELLRRYTLDIYGPLPNPTDTGRERSAGSNHTISSEGARSASFEDRPVLSAPAPVIVFFHGGSWLRGDKVTILIVDRFLRRMRERGWFVVSVNYTTSFLRGLGGPVKQAEEALRWVRKNGAVYGWDPTRIGVYGVSAGGHVGLLAAERIIDDNPRDRFAFIFAECAPTDLVAMRDGDAFGNSGSFRVFPERRLRALSPIRYVSPQTPPVLLFHGDEDEMVHIDQSIRYAAALEAAGGEVELVLWPGGDHAFLNLSDEEWYIQETVALDWFSAQFESNR
ncbi:MAG: alpha/beta hydrolase [Alkalispirochaeta sp.]